MTRTPPRHCFEWLCSAASACSCGITTRHAACVVRSLTGGATKLFLGVVVATGCVSGLAKTWDFPVSSLLRSSHITSTTPSVAGVFDEVETRKRTSKTSSPKWLCWVPPSAGSFWQRAGEGRPSPFGESSHGFQLSHAPCGACPGTCLGVPAFGLHSASAAPFTRKPRVQSSGGPRRS